MILGEDIILMSKYLDFWEKLSQDEQQMLIKNSFCVNYTKGENIHNKDTTLLRKEGWYLQVYYKGSYQNISEMYAKIIEYAVNHGIKLGKYAYEEYLIFEIGARNQDDYVTLILVETLK